MHSFPTFMEESTVEATLTARVIDRYTKFDVLGFLGWNVEILGQPGEIVQINQGHYRTPIGCAGKITWASTDDSHIPPILQEGGTVVLQYGPGEIIVWCPSEELADAAFALVQELESERELEECTSMPELRIIDEGNRDRDKPIVQWSGWLRSKLHTHEGQLPRQFDRHVLQRRTGDDWSNESESSQGHLFAQLVNTPHATKRVSG